MVAAYVTEVFGKTPTVNKATRFQTSVVGKIQSEFPLNSPTFEVVTLEFEGDYAGFQCNDAQDVLTFVKGIDGVDRCVVSPIITVASSYKIPIHVLASGNISTIEPPANKNYQIVRPDGNCRIAIITPGTTSNSVIEWSFKIPDNIRIDRKVIFIKRFNMFVSGCSSDHLSEIRAGNIIIPEMIGEPKPLIDIHIKGNVPKMMPIYYSVNGIFGNMIVEPCGDPHGTITLRIGGSVFTEHFSNKDLLGMDNTLYKLWHEFGGVELLVDIDQDRLCRTHDELHVSDKRLSPEDIGIVSELRSEVAKQKKIIEMRDRVIEELRSKIAESEEKVKQEELKTKREELRYHGSVVDQRYTTLMEVIKLGGSILGIASLFITLSAKMNTQKKLIEWSVPIFIKKGFSSSLTMPSPTTLAIVGTIALIGVGYWIYKKNCK